MKISQDPWINPWPTVVKRLKNECTYMAASTSSHREKSCNEHRKPFIHEIISNCWYSFQFFSLPMAFKFIFYNNICYLNSEALHGFQFHFCNESWLTNKITWTQCALSDDAMKSFSCHSDISCLWIKTIWYVKHWT